MTTYYLSLSVFLAKKTPSVVKNEIGLANVLVRDVSVHVDNLKAKSPVENSEFVCDISPWSESGGLFLLF